MTNIDVKQTGINPANGAAKYGLKIDDQVVGIDLSKVDVMMNVWSALHLPDYAWESVKAELQKLEP